MLCLQVFPVFNELVDGTPSRMFVVTTSAIAVAGFVYAMVGLAGYDLPSLILVCMLWH